MRQRMLEFLFTRIGKKLDDARYAESGMEDLIEAHLDDIEDYFEVVKDIVKEGLTP